MAKKIEDYEWFCPQPFINVVEQITGVVKPCCVIKGWDFTPNGTIMENHHSEKVRNFRKEFINGGGPMSDKYCIVCKEQEKHSPTESHRNMYLSKFNGEWADYKKKVEKYLDTDWKEPFIITLEYNAPDNYCNLKCHMCHPMNSSTLAVEDFKIGSDRINSNRFKKSGPHYKGPALEAKEYDPFLKNLHELKLVGGETLAIKLNYDLIQRVVDLGLAGDMNLMITTNATLTPKFNGKDIFDYIPLFKNVQINVSIECWGERNNYIRYGSDWNVILKNAHRFAENAKVLFATTINSLNIGHQLDVALNTVKLQKENPNFLHFACGSLVFGPGEIYTPLAVPVDIRERFIDHYFENAPLKFHRDFSKIISLLENTEFDESKMEIMIKDVKARDKLRGTCLPDVFPEWEPYYV